MRYLNTKMESSMRVGIQLASISRTAFRIMSILRTTLYLFPALDPYMPLSKKYG